MITKERYQQIRQITLLGALINIFLGVLKVTFGILGHSNALFADGIHSFSDLATDLLVIIASRFGEQTADIDHPYGHGRIETAATMFLALLLILAGIGIIGDAIYDLSLNKLQQPSSYVMLIALLSVVLNEGLFYFTRRVANRIHSSLLMANAWHHRSDAASSVIVLIGVGGALLGYHYFDTLAAIIVGGLVIKMGGKLGWSSIQELVDTGVPPAVLKQIETIICHTDGVLALHQLRTRSMGGKILLDVHILVNSRLSVSEGHHVGQQVHLALENTMPKITDVTVHIDPEDDEVAQPSLNLPPRKSIEKELKKRLQGLLADSVIKNMMLHYLSGKIDIDMFISTPDELKSVNLDTIETLLQTSLQDIAWLGHVRVYTRH